MSIAGVETFKTVTRWLWLEPTQRQTHYTSSSATTAGHLPYLAYFLFLHRGGTIDKQGVVHVAWQHKFS